MMMKCDETPEFRVSKGYIPYEDALVQMKERVEAIQKHEASELVWFLEHPPLYTLGTSANESDVLDKTLPSYKTGRGGQVTYHGPGQRVAYLMLDLSKREKDIKAYVFALEEWLILTLKELGIDAFRREGRVGLWVPETSFRDRKIAAIGVRVTKWVTYHGIALNVNPDLNHFDGIVPCGIKGHGVTSLYDLGVKASMQEVDDVLQKTFSQVF